ncbi:alpha/beta-hydrolase [Coprinellus micaceus]|uniref:Alpha/beta-hydrolase n=1 Tax=Coprinellus micaceus TaxID=71717 RepID=A0A4Y7SM11_COPMI|nr:alpha/beta-hydrolase [Coprinellus micaceus]
MTQETPFTINVPDAKLDLFRRKLEVTTLPDELEDADRDYGAPLSDIERLLVRWKGGYDWRKHEAALNAELPQFTRKIGVEGHGDFDIHYVHKRSGAENAIPLLFVHGWPGSFMEVRKILPLLVEASGEHPSFHVVALSLPGYGFSSAPIKRGFAVHHYAEVSHKLMLALGYNEYVVQGGDWGFYITQTIALEYGGDHVKAWHTNYQQTMTIPEFNNAAQNSASDLTESEKAGIERTQWFIQQGHGYADEQGTQPQTLGYSLADSPVGLLAWIYEKLVNWTDGYGWEDDEVLTWVSMYWFSRAGPAATLRIYYERRVTGWTWEPPNVPTGYSYFPREIWRLPPRWLKQPNLVFESEHTEGGHFAAHEKPDLLVGDLRKMFGKDGPAFGVVPGKTGYA